MVVSSEPNCQHVIVTCGPRLGLLKLCDPDEDCTVLRMSLSVGVGIQSDRTRR